MQRNRQRPTTGRSRLVSGRQQVTGETGMVILRAGRGLGPNQPSLVEMAAGYNQCNLLDIHLLANWEDRNDVVAKRCVIIPR